jgi:hypothetical protein
VLLSRLPPPPFYGLGGIADFLAFHVLRYRRRWW